MPNADRVVIVGAGPAGMATAIELAQNGVPSVVLEKRGPVATRQPLFAVMPPFADRLAALDPEGSLTSLLAPVDRFRSTSSHAPEGPGRTFGSPLAPDTDRSRGDIGAIIRAAGAPNAPDADQRGWGLAGIDSVDNGLRELARTKYRDLIELRTDAEVTGIAQGEGWAEALLAPGADAAARDTVRGALLVDASGRDLLRGPRTTWPEQTHWLGARFAAPTGDHAITRHQGSAVKDGPSHLTIGLPGEDRTFVWTQVPGDPKAIGAADARALVQARAADVGVSDALADDAPTIPVSVQMWTGDEPVSGRVLKVGDSVRAPYFVTSTGAATALVHDAPRAVDAILAVRGGMPVQQALGAYADSVLAANTTLMELVRPRLVADAKAIGAT